MKERNERYKLNKKKEIEQHDFVTSRQASIEESKTQNKENRVEYQIERRE